MAHTLSAGHVCFVHGEGSSFLCSMSIRRDRFHDLVHEKLDLVAGLALQNFLT